MNSRVVVVAACAAFTSLASVAQTSDTAADVMRAALQIVGELERTPGCDFSLHGEPLLDEMTDRWLIAYSGVGDACEDMGTALQRQGTEAEITFFRRPNDEEVVALIGKMRAAVRRGFPCQISFKGEPAFDAESDLWDVQYYASGDQCEEASNTLERQGKTFRVAFSRIR
jgi:hypothetical protein